MDHNRMPGKFGAVADIMTTLKVLGIEPASFNRMVDELPVNLWVHDEDYRIVYGNSSFRENFGPSQNETCHQRLMSTDSICGCCLSRKARSNERFQRCELCKRKSSGYDFNIYHTPTICRDGSIYILKSSLYAKDFKNLAETRFLDNVNRGGKRKFLIMCATCKRARDQNNNWVAVHSAIIACFNVPISHGICRDCAKKLYPTMDLGRLS